MDISSLLNNSSLPQSRKAAAPHTHNHNLSWCNLSIIYTHILYIWIFFSLIEDWIWSYGLCSVNFITSYFHQWKSMVWFILNFQYLLWMSFWSFSWWKVIVRAFCFRTISSHFIPLVCVKVIANFPWMPLLLERITHQCFFLCYCHGIISFEFHKLIFLLLNWYGVHLMHSGEGLSVHIYNKCHATRLLDNSVCDVSYLDILKN